MGLLSERASPVSSPRSSFFSKFRKSSLPTKALSKPSEMLYSRGEGRFYPNNDPPPQFTNPFGGESPAATNELRSFLSLDLAADGSSTARRSSKFLSPLDTSPSTVYSATLSPYVSNATAQLGISELVDRRQRLSDTMAPLSAPPPRRPSRDSLRTLPSPGPAPSAALPEIPSERETARPLSPIVIPSPSLFQVTSLSASSGGSPFVFPQPPHSAPPSTGVPSYVSPRSPIVSPLSPTSPPISRRTQQHSFMSFSSNTTSVRSSRRRNAERSNALACLEGLSCVPGRVSRNSRQQNFMSMSDDEDEEEADTDATGADADVEDDDGDSFPPLSPLPPAPRSARMRTLSSVLPTSLTLANAAATTEIRSPIDEEEDCVLPPAAFSALRQTSPSKPRARSRRSTLESWFPPLANFIDFKDDELSGWRGVVEIVNGL